MSFSRLGASSGPLPGIWLAWFHTQCRLTFTLVSESVCFSVSVSLVVSIPVSVSVSVSHCLSLSLHRSLSRARARSVSPSLPPSLSRIHSYVFTQAPLYGLQLWALYQMHYMRQLPRIIPRNECRDTSQNFGATSSSSSSVRCRGKNVVRWIKTTKSSSNKHASARWQWNIEPCAFGKSKTYEIKRFHTRSKSTLGNGPHFLIWLFSVFDWYF